VVTATVDTHWLSVEEAAGHLKVAPSTLYRWRTEGRLRFYRFGPKNVRIKREDLDGLATPVLNGISTEELAERREWGRRVKDLRERIRAQCGRTTDSALITRQMRDERSRRPAGS